MGRYERAARRRDALAISAVVIGAFLAWLLAICVGLAAVTLTVALVWKAVM